MRAAARLRSHAIGDYAGPETDGPRTTLPLALLAAAGVMLPWVQGAEWSKRGWSYEQGLIALGAAIAAAYISAARAEGKIRRTWFEALGLACALVGLGATLWFYFDVVGSTDTISRQLISSFGLVRVVGAIGLYVSMAGFLGQIGVLLWHLDFGIQRRARIALQSPWAAAALLAVAAGGVLLPWEPSFRSPEPGWSYNVGLIAFVAAIEAGIVCGLRLSGRIRALPYAIAAALCAAVGLAAVVWFHNDAVYGVDPKGYPLLVWWLNSPRSEAGLRESVSAAGFIAALVVLAWHLWQASRRTI